MVALAVPPGPVNVRAKPGEDGALEPGLAGVGAGGGPGRGPAMSEVTWSLLQRWGASLRRGADFDSWGQLVEAIDEYQM